MLITEIVLCVHTVLRIVLTKVKMSLTVCTFQHKPGHRGVEKRYKARLVPCGYDQL